MDMHNYVQQLTDNYDEDKLNLLCQEFDEFIQFEFEEWSSSYSKDFKQKKFNEWPKNRALPIEKNRTASFQFLFVRDFFLRTRFGKPIPDEEYEKGIRESFKTRKLEYNILDLNTLLGGFYFLHNNVLLYTLRDVLISLKRKYTSSVYRYQGKLNPAHPDNQKNNLKPIIWLNPEVLNQFVESLKAHQLIEERETEEIINNHFKALTGQNGESEPIKWQKSNRLLSYLITELSKAELIETEGKQWKLISEHFIRKNGENFNTDSLKQDALNMKYTSHPNGYKIVDKVINSIS